MCINYNFGVIDQQIDYILTINMCILRKNMDIVTFVKHTKPLFTTVTMYLN